MFPGHLAYYEADLEDPWEYRWIGWGGTQAGDYIAKAGLSPEAPTHHHHRRAELIQLFDQLHHVQGSMDVKELTVTSVLYQMMALLLNESPVSRTRQAGQFASNRHVDNAMQFMTLNYAEQLTVSVVASHVGLERSYFSKIFKTHTGKPPHEYLFEVRMRQAALLLTTTDLTIEAVAYSTGFNHINHFSSSFHQHFCVPPSKYRKLHSDAK